MITDSRAVAVRSLNLVIVGWLRVVHSSESSLVEAPGRHFSKANGPTGCVVESSYSGAGDDLSIVAPFTSQAAITIEHTYVGALERRVLGDISSRAFNEARAAVIIGSLDTTLTLK